MHKDPSKAPVWLTPIARSLQTFLSYIEGDLGNYFLTREYIEALAEARNTAQRRVVKGTAWIFLLLILMNVVEIPEVFRTPFLEVNLRSVEYVRDLIALLSAAAFMGLSFSILDMFIIDRMLANILLKFNVFSPHYFYAHKSYQGLWTDALQSRSFGLQSGAAHKFIGLLGGLFMFPVFLSAFVIPPYLILQSCFAAIDASQLWSVRGVLNAAAIFIVSGTLIIVAVCALAPVRFFEGFLKEGRLANAAIDEEAAQRIFGPTDRSGGT